MQATLMQVYQNLRNSAVVKEPKWGHLMSGKHFEEEKVKLSLIIFLFTPQFSSFSQPFLSLEIGKSRGVARGG